MARSWDDITPNQRKYTLEMIVEAGLLDTKMAGTPM